MPSDPSVKTSGPRVIVRDEHRAYVQLDCLPHKDAEGNDLVGGQCRFRLRRDAAGETAEGKHWQWDGNTDQPTISPSIWCQSCGKHITVVAGVER